MAKLEEGGNEAARVKWHKSQTLPAAVFLVKLDEQRVAMENSWKKMFFERKVQAPYGWQVTILLSRANLILGYLGEADMR